MVGKIELGAVYDATTLWQIEVTLNDIIDILTTLEKRLSTVLDKNVELKEENEYLHRKCDELVKKI